MTKTKGEKPQYTQEERQAYLEGIVLRRLQGEQVSKEEYKVTAGYIDERTKGLSEYGESRFGQNPEIQSLHKKALDAYPDACKAIISQHRDTVLKYLNNDPTGPRALSEEEYKTIASVLEGPLTHTKEKGGLTYAAYNAANEMGDKELLDAAQNYRERVRVKILTPLYLADLYTRQQSGEKLSQREKEDLREGIVTFENGEKKSIPFVRGNELTKEGRKACEVARRAVGGKRGEMLKDAINLSYTRNIQKRSRPPGTNKSVVDKNDNDMDMD